MNNETVTVRNRITRAVSRVPRRIAEHPIFGAVLEIVPAGSKSIISFGPAPAAEETEKPEKASNSKGGKR